MIARNAIAPAATALVLFAAPAHAGPCTDRIYQADLKVEKLLDAAAANGAPAPQSSFATMHRQPTPGTVASAEEKAGDLSSAQVQAITEDLDAARDADDKGDRAACEKALNEVDRMLSH
jgi:hypothetical protein